MRKVATKPHHARMKVHARVAAAVVVVVASAMASVRPSTARPSLPKHRHWLRPQNPLQQKRLQQPRPSARMVAVVAVAAEVVVSAKKVKARQKCRTTRTLLKAKAMPSRRLRLLPRRKLQRARVNAVAAEAAIVRIAHHELKA